MDGNGVTRTDVGKFTVKIEQPGNPAHPRRRAPLNVASETTSGLDFQADYRMDLFGGLLDWHALGNYNDERTITKLGVTVDVAPDRWARILRSSPDPSSHSTLAATYSKGPWSGTVQGRFTGSSRLVNTWVEGVNVDNNAVPWVAYMDLRLSYSWTDNLQIYGAIDNTFNTPPPSIPNSLGGGAGNFNLQIYDGLGRQFRVGLRFTD